MHTHTYRYETNTNITEKSRKERLLPFTGPRGDLPKLPTPRPMNLGALSCLEGARKSKGGLTRKWGRKGGREGQSKEAKG